MPEFGSAPLVSVLIVTYNGYALTRRCIDAVRCNEYPHYEIILVDNGSSDGTVEAASKDFGDNIKIIALRENLGPSAARNRGMEAASGEFVAFLDNDTVPDSKWLINGIARMAVDSKIGAVQCRLMLNSDRKRFDYAGDYFGSCGFLVQRVRTGEEDVGQADNEAIIFSAKSAGMLCRRDAFDAVGGFDDDYFIFVEETDLALRMWLAGYTALYLPTSVVYHEFGSSRDVLDDRHTRLVRFHGCKNYVCTLTKCLEARTLLRVLPVHLALWVAFAGWNTVKGEWRSALWIIEGLWWNVAKLRSTIKKRRIIQQYRIVPDSKIIAQVGKANSISGLIGKARVVDVGNHISRVRKGDVAP